MKLLSVQVAMPREVMWQGRSVTTGIFKQPVGDAYVMLRKLNLDGDGQADLTVHGGPNKAVYGYPSEHYPFWRAEFPDMQLPHGMFGENLTSEGLLESEICIGDRLRVGEAELVITQPRLPCFKLGIKFGRDDIIKRFLASGRSGFYLAVAREGKVRAGDTIEMLSRDRNHVTVEDILRLRASDANDFETMRRAVRIEALPESWRERFIERLAEGSG
jgi:MOSC domain-containing protein YiiM